MTTDDLKLVTRNLSHQRKLEVIEERSFSAGNTCFENFQAEGLLVDLRVALQAWRVTLQSMRDQARYFSNGKKKKS